MNWHNVFAWIRSTAAGVAVTSYGVSQIPGLPPKWQGTATAVTLVATLVAGGGQVAKEVSNPATFPQTPLITPQGAPDGQAK